MYIYDSPQATAGQNYWAAGQKESRRTRWVAPQVGVRESASRPSPLERAQKDGLRVYCTQTSEPTGAPLKFWQSPGSATGRVRSG